ncbi:FAD/NAD(P)-binding domain-containing protein [Rhizodiscina lignyota]|uniref:FAD/NAD(P)-binding domain-containing protein n=1 Tax=Rhizodiscina lignyota TaxID=1504668 RepID=A0A9P4I858_9PEZI|nr:FAD/NAD(P)-binding domain-containing protein [Rhizodiscina lignyota]
MPKLNIVIVGGSLGGLCTGLALKQLGHDVTILERNPDNLLHNQGAGIVAGGDTLEFFKRYDRCSRSFAVSSQKRLYLDRDANVVHRVDMVQNMTSWDLSYYMLRANFDGVKSDYCDVPPVHPDDGKAVHLHGHKVIGLEDEGDQVNVTFEKSNGERGSIKGDVVVGADGPNSTVRSLLVRNVERTYAGYCALRGTVPEDEATDAAREAFQERFTFFHGPGIQILAYTIPGPNGAVEKGKRLLNFVYYTNFPAESLDKPDGPLKEILTDVDGMPHRITLPPGKINPAVWEKRKNIARENLPRPFADLVCATKKPFVQAITDVISPENEFMGGKVVLIGDALAGFRPHTVASTSQAAFDAMILADMLEGKISRKEWKLQTMCYARTIQKRGVDMGNRSQFGDLPLEEHIKDRDRASKPRREEVWPEWAKAGLEDIPTPSDATEPRL